MSKKKIPYNSYVIIIGAMKSGTSFLYDYLVAHPEICACKIKEPEFFSQTPRSIKVDSYEDLWEYNPELHKLVMEASTGYTKYPAQLGVPERIFNYKINPKFVYVIRNPFDRILSHYNFLKIDPNFDLNQTLDNDRFVALSKYYLQLYQFLKYFTNKDKYLIVNFSELVNEPSSVIEKVLDFLDLDKTNYSIQDYTIKNQTPRMSKAEQFLFRSKLIQISQLMPSNWKNKIKLYLRKQTPLSYKKSFSEEEFNTVYYKLYEDMLKLEAEFGIDISQWGF